MILFGSAREAKEFLVARIVDQAQREGISLSEVERGMLYFTETGWAPADIISTMERFECQYDAADYERKIAQLIRNARQLADQQEFDAWTEAIRTLDKEDHYLGVMLDQAGATVPAVRPPGDLLKLFGSAFAIVLGFLCLIYLADRLGLKLDILLWVAACCVLVVYLVLRACIGQKRRQELLDKLVSFFDRPK
jgi:Flp pilus assembly protein TadB